MVVGRNILVVSSFLLIALLVATTANTLYLLTDPVAWQAYLMPANASIIATVTGDGGNLDRVDFYVDGVLVGSDGSSMFSNYCYADSWGMVFVKDYGVVRGEGIAHGPIVDSAGSFWQAY